MSPLNFLSFKKETFVQLHFFSGTGRATVARKLNVALDEKIIIKKRYGVYKERCKEREIERHVTDTVCESITFCR